MTSFPTFDHPPVLAVLDYGMGNLRSVCKALEACGGKVRLIDQPDQLGDAEALVFPGQGAIGGCMQRLRTTGWDTVLHDWIAADKPYFGICLGLQALFEESEESAEPGLGIIPGKVVRFQRPPECKIPHMGWNAVDWAGDPDILLAGLPQTGGHFYFVHSYHACPADPSVIWGTTDYAGSFVSAIRRGNCLATQFHPEKSQFYGLRLYRNFLEWVHLSRL